MLKIGQIYPNRARWRIGAPILIGRLCTDFGNSVVLVNAELV